MREMAKREVATARVRILPAVDGVEFLRSAAQTLLDTADQVEALGDREPVSDGAAAVRAEARDDDPVLLHARIDDLLDERKGLHSELGRVRGLVREGYGREAELRKQRDQARDFAVAFQQEADHNEELLAKRDADAKDAIRGVLLELVSLARVAPAWAVTPLQLHDVAKRHGVTL